MPPVMSGDTAYSVGPDQMAVVRPGEYAGMPTLAAMGPEPLSEDFREEGFAALAAQYRRLP